MHPDAWRIAALLMAVAAAAAQGDPRPASPGQWPPGVQPVPGGSPPLPPERALETFHLAPGYRVELVAAEPLVQDPVAIDFDPGGRIWAVEMPGYMRDIAGGGEHAPIGRVVVLEDADGNGTMDRRTVFADGLVMPRAVKVLDGGVLVGEPPHVWLMRDTDGDGRMDAKDAITDRYGRREIDPQNNANALVWALDNWIHVAGQAEIALRLKNGAVEVRRTLRRGQWGVTQDDEGRLFRNTNESALHVDVVPTSAFARNPNLLRTRGSYERLADGNPDLNLVWPVRPTPATNRAYQFGILRADGALARYTAVCAPVVYRGDRLPPELYGNVFVAEPAANLVSRLVLREDESGLRAEKAYPRGEFLASTDERFRPVFLSNAPDGTLYIVDMYRGILEHRLSMTEYLRDQILSRELEQPTGMGRIYRVVHETTRRDTATGIPAAPVRLVEMLSHTSGWWRDTAQRLLVERLGASASGRTEAAAALAALADRAPDWRTRLHALWTLDGIGALEPQLVARALEHASPAVRASALRLAERWLGEPGHPLQEPVLRRVHDRDWRVRRQAAASLGALPADRRVGAIVSLLDRYGHDPITLDAAISGVRGSEPAVLARLLRIGRDATPQREASTAMLSATILRTGQEAAVQDLFTWIAARSRPAWQRSALLAGAEIALLGAPMPGATPPAGRSAAADEPVPCHTCPGGRAGPGGAYAYPRPPAPASNSGGRLALGREPAALTRLEPGDGLRERADLVLARVTWPGKPGEPAVAPLTPGEQRRFEAGREVYRNLCQACHQPDGRGQDRLAPTLIGSPLALGPADIAARILLHGKEGSFGLMPPIGSSIGDDEIASVLTYVRREWGQTAAPVDAATVAAVRAATRSRTRPWTDAELQQLAGAVEGRD